MNKFGVPIRNDSIGMMMCYWNTIKLIAVQLHVCMSDGETYVFNNNMYSQFENNTFPIFPNWECVQAFLGFQCFSICFPIYWFSWFHMFFLRSCFSTFHWYSSFSNLVFVSQFSWFPVFLLFFQVFTRFRSFPEFEVSHAFQVLRFSNLFRFPGLFGFVSGIQSSLTSTGPLDVGTWTARWIPRGQRRSSRPA